MMRRLTGNVTVLDGVNVNLPKVATINATAGKILPHYWYCWWENVVDFLPAAGKSKRVWPALDVFNTLTQKCKQDPFEHMYIQKGIIALF